MFLEEIENKINVIINGIDAISHNYGWHADMINNDFDIWQILQGQVELFVEQKRLVLQKGDIFLIAPHKKFTINILEDNTKYIYCHFDIETNIANKSINKYMLSSYINLKNSGLRHAFEYRKQGGKFSLLKLRICITKLMHQYFVENSETINQYINSAFKVAKFDEVLSYIEDNLHTKISNETLAGICGFAEKYFIVYFKKIMGVTPSEYIMKLKMEKAKNYLSLSKMPVSELAQKMGFYDQPAFSRAFKKYFGVSPSFFIKEK